MRAKLFLTAAMCGFITHLVRVTPTINRNDANLQLCCRVTNVLYVRDIYSSLSLNDVNRALLHGRTHRPIRNTYLGWLDSRPRCWASAAVVGFGQHRNSVQQSCYN